MVAAEVRRGRGRDAAGCCQFRAGGGRRTASAGRTAITAQRAPLAAAQTSGVCASSDGGAGGGDQVEAHLDFLFLISNFD